MPTCIVRAHRPSRMNSGARFAKNAATPSCRSLLSKICCCATVDIDRPASSGRSCAASTSCLREPVRQRSARGDGRGELARAVERRAVVDDAVDEAPRQRLLGGDRLAGEQQLLGARRARPGASAAARRCRRGRPAATRSGRARRRVRTTRRSHASASSSPPPSAGPSIAAIVGIGRRASRRSTMSSNRILCSLASCRRSREFLDVAAGAERARVAAMQDHAANVGARRRLRPARG